MSVLSWAKRKLARPRALAGTSFQFMSDLHLEVSNQYDTFEFEVTAPYLILAGDIGRMVDYDGYLRFLARQTSRYTKVFLVMGNHEFYTMSFDDGIAKAQQLEKEPALGGKLVLLHKGHHVLAGTTIPVHVIGCTLWTQVPEKDKEVVSKVVSDFKHIQNWTVESHNTRHEEDLGWLEDKIASLGDSEEQIAVVVTHHAPCTKGTSSPEYMKNAWASAFSTELLGSRSWGSVVRYWVFGHTHYSNMFDKNGITVVANQRGYVFPTAKPLRNAVPPTEKEKKHLFDVARVIEA